MTDFKDRERAFENKFAHDEEMKFKIQARRDKLTGLWAADKMGLSGEARDAYAQTIVKADFEEPGDEDVIRKLLADFQDKGLEMDRDRILEVLQDKEREAISQLAAG